MKLQAMANKFVWWEKTVEYAFVLDTKKSFNFAAPLAGQYERAGDGIFARGSKLVLIEFKRNRAALASEHEKFRDFKSAAALLEKDDAHHFVVYGDEVTQQEGRAAQLDLVAQTYFSSDKVIEVDRIFDNGIGIDAFNSYLEKFLKLKLDDGRSTGTVGPTAYASVFGLSPEKELKSVSMEEYLVLELKYELGFEPPTRSYDAGFRM